VGYFTWVALTHVQNMHTLRMSKSMSVHFMASAAGQELVIGLRAGVTDAAASHGTAPVNCACAQSAVFPAEKRTMHACHVRLWRRVFYGVRRPACKCMLRNH
jgi:hypothetical protein